MESFASLPALSAETDSAEVLGFFLSRRCCEFRVFFMVVPGLIGIFEVVWGFLSS